jgi:UDP-glucose 4-epimerase
VALRYFNAREADPDGRIGGPLAGDPPDPARHRGGGRHRGLRCSATLSDADGTCLRDYVHVSDLADAHVRALEAIAETGKSGAYNLGTGRPHSVRGVIDTVERVTGRRVPWTLAPRRAGDPAVLYAGARKRSQLHWTPRFSISRPSCRPPGTGTARTRRATCGGLCG